MEHPQGSCSIDSQSRSTLEDPHSVDPTLDNDKIPITREQLLGEERDFQPCVMSEDEYTDPDINTTPAPPPPPIVRGKSHTFRVAKKRKTRDIRNSSYTSHSKADRF